MIVDLKTFCQKPTPQNIEEYPTILDILDSLAAEDAKDLRYSFPLMKEEQGFLHDLFCPGKYLLLTRGSMKAELLPTSFSPYSFFRGQSKYYEECKPSLLRENNEVCKEKNMLLSALQEAEMTEALERHPVIINLAVPFVKKGLPYIPNVFYSGLAQHYGIKTTYMDLTNEKWVAAFFATTTYHNDIYAPVEIRKDTAFDDKYGVFYMIRYTKHQDRDLLKDGIHPIGQQYFNRPGRQFGSVIDLSGMQDLHKFDLLEKCFFRHDNECAQLIWKMSFCGRKYWPDDKLACLVKRILKEIRFSKRAIERAHKKAYSYMSLDAFYSMISNYGLCCVDNAPVEFNFIESLEELELWNREGRQRFDEKLIAPRNKTITQEDIIAALLTQ